jgi:ribosomal protein S18 acetylase RimI-like enzyme
MEINREIRPVGRDDIDTLAGVLAAAFETDPLSRWMFGEHAGLRDRLRASFVKALGVIYVPKGHSYTTDDLAGAALWSAPNKWKMSFFQQLRLAPSFLRLLGPRRAAQKGSPMARLVERAHPSEPHWYLGVLGVDPARQRSGVGNALVRPMLERADREHTLAYLETSKAENVPYYERFGFGVREELKLPHDGPPVWTMERKPQ